MVDGTQQQMQNGDQALLDSLLKGMMTINDVRLAMGKIPSPVDAQKPEVIFREMAKNQQVRQILIFSLGGEIDNYAVTNAAHIMEFLAKYPMPMDYDEKAREFLSRYPAYAFAMQQFRNFVYGGRQAYWNKIQRLSAVAADMRAKKEAEAAYGNSGAFAVTRADVEGHPSGDVLSDDAYYESDIDGFYAIFDGVGGHEGGRDASQACMRGIRRLLRQFYIDNIQNLFFVANELDRMVKEIPDHGFTTGVLVKLIGEEGKPRKMCFVSVGNSRLYVARKGKVFLLTQDESNGETILNAFGSPTYAARQGGELDLELGDRLILCTDGVTGSGPADALNNMEIADVLNAMPNDQIAAQRLVKIARKLDDRTIIVKTIR